MEERKNILVSNYAAFIPYEKDARRYKIVTDENNNEVGIEVSGEVTNFSAVNFNGLKFDKKSYDECIREYFEKNELNIPIDLMHQRDMQHLAGVARKFVKKTDSVQVVAFIPKGVYFYNLIKLLIDNGVLQGFSNMGYMTDWEYDRETDACIVKSFQLISISLVDVPADTAGKFVSNATDFEGFNFTKEPVTEQGMFNCLGLF